MIVIENVLSHSQLTQIHTWLDSAAWDDGAVTAGQQAQQTKHNQQVQSGSQINQHIETLILDTLSRHPIFISASLPDKIYPPMINRYRQGDHYGYHIDNAIRIPPASTTRVRTDISATLFLSKPQEYDGGELEIQEQYGTQRIKLNAGDLVLYPATSRHQVTPVTRGERTAVVFWIQSMIRDNEQRTMLFELDQSIQSLTQRLGHDDDEVIQLTGLYHNLIRQWADT
jgi:PKHD-type hydroxylase